MDPENIMLSEIIQTEKDKYYVISLIIIQMNVYKKQKQTHRHRKQTYGCQGGKGEWEGQIRSMELTDTNYYT